MNTEAIINNQYQTNGLGAIDIQIYDELEPLKETWKNLESNGVCSLYQRFEWMQGWTTRVAGPARIKPRLVLGSVGGTPLFIFPLGLRKRGPFTVVSWLGDSHTNFHMGLSSKEFLRMITPADMRKLIDHIITSFGRVDILELCCQPVVWEQRTNPFTYLKWQESHNHGFALKLEDSFKATLDRKNGSRKRKKYRWQRNKLEAIGGAKLRLAESRDEVNEFLDVAFQQMGRRFNKSGIWNRFQDEGVASFMRELAIVSLQNEEPALQIYGLEIDGKLRATFAGGVRGKQFSGCFISLANDEYSYISPGEMIIYLVIEDCVHRGFEFFDLGRGEERYKTSWCDSTIAMFETNVAFTKFGVSYALYERAKLSLKRLVRNNKTLWKIAKKIRSKFYGRV
ncbi:MAG: GNAT family N-acetyltransferase [Rhizobiaceae bacterium]